MDWLLDQYQAAKRPGVMESTLAVLRAQVGLLGQREVLLDELTQVRMPTLIVWGALDHVVPVVQAGMAVRQLPDASLRERGVCRLCGGAAAEPPHHRTRIFSPPLQGGTGEGYLGSVRP